MYAISFAHLTCYLSISISPDGRSSVDDPLGMPKLGFPSLSNINRWRKTWRLFHPPSNCNFEWKYIQYSESSGDVVMLAWRTPCTLSVPWKTGWSALIQALGSNGSQSGNFNRS